MSSKNRGTILVVDDNPVNLSVVSKILVDEGYQVRVAVDGLSAIAQIEYSIEHLDQGLPDLILLDVQMPGIDGFETCATLKSKNCTSDIPIVFMTALSDTENKVKGLSLGAVDYITKPFQEAEVLARVKVHLQIRFLIQELEEKTFALETANQKLERLASLDGLTQVSNRRQFDQHLLHTWQKMQQEQQPISVILCDVDFFKQYNDTYGHQAGDVCLKKVARTLANIVQRPVDLVARYGGEEFALILSHTSSQGAIQMAEIIRQEIHTLQIPHTHSLVRSFVTMSMGIATVIPRPSLAPDVLIAGADAALYTAKQEGRDRYCLHSQYLYDLGDIAFYPHVSLVQATT